MKLIRALSCILACGMLFSCGGGGGGSGETTQAPETLVPSAPEAPLAVRTCVLRTGEIPSPELGGFSMAFKFQAQGGSVTGKIDECSLNIPSVSPTPLKFTGGTWEQINESSGDMMSRLKFTCEGLENGSTYKIQLMIDSMKVVEKQEIDGMIAYMEAVATSAAALLKYGTELDSVVSNFQTRIYLDYK